MNNGMHDVRDLRPTVLVLDDDSESLLLVSTMLDYCDYRAITAQDYQQAAKAMEQDHPAAMVLDLLMPQADANRWLARLAETRSRLPIILISSDFELLGQTQSEALKAGVNVVGALHKPFWIEPLLNALEVALPEGTAFAA